MTNLENISYYEKLHDIFEQVHPRDLPIKVDKLIKFLTEGAEHLERTSGEAPDISGIVDTLEDMKRAFAASLTRSSRSILLSHQERNYEVNIYPIRAFLSENSLIAGELAELKSIMVTLANEKNLGLLKQCYSFVDGLSIALEA